MRLRVISLDRTPQRLAVFRAQNPGLAFERFAACDGAARPRAAWIADGLIAPENVYLPGAIGCAASHVSLWRACVAEGQPVHVAEDDVILRRDFVEMATALLAGLVWDVVYWTWNFNWPLDHWPAEGLAPALLQLDPRLILRHYEAFRRHTGRPLMARIASGAGTGCYSIAPSGAARLLAACLPIGNVPARMRAGNLILDWDNTGIDVEASRHFRELRAFATIPPLAVAMNDGALSTIRGPGAGG
jgi:GR25 family glycosyltransferase involved in LPS biosynthesis